MQLDDLLRRYGSLVDEAIRRILPTETDEIGMREILGFKDGALDREAIQKSFTGPAWDLIERGGKRWRAIMMILAYEALGGDYRDVIDFSVIPELIHNGTLAVDDVEDRGEYRRGKPCIHRIYGEDVAINMGNTLYYYPLLTVLRRHELPHLKELKLHRTYIEEMLRLSIGQSTDIGWHRHQHRDLTEEHYITMVKMKTGSLVRLATRYACILAGADDIEDEIIRYSDAISTAFQIQDDVLNLIGDPKKYGKERGGDIKEGKITLLVIHALRNLKREDADRLSEILSKHTTDQSLLDEAIELIKKSGAIEYGTKFSLNLLDEAISVLESVLRPSEARESLIELSRFLVLREY
ncbi:MAG: polyprenyl synthetase family protein [Aigarchaeota archaeon]|nr:polyprenyl synthetase family protein [Aigarchaeota archaeon]MDW8093025.1 polyprenyl synthetase family protein [Nitrososphaerota archaeon]